MSKPKYYNFTVPMTPQMKQALEILAKRNYRPVTWQARILLEQALREEGFEVASSEEAEPGEESTAGPQARYIA